ncbi:MAG TPA: hypothetical protein VEB18_02885 [Candidatus Paceibacterota bacterium]|nr:hypothetical protein [Candidatus Paceibacterota bacterium]
MKRFASSLIALIGLTPLLARAQEGVLVNPLRADSLPELIAVILGAVVEIGSIALVLALVWVGFRFVRAQGNDTELKNAREALMWTVVGGLILLGSAVISEVVQRTVEQL